MQNYSVNIIARTQGQRSIEKLNKSSKRLEAQTRLLNRRFQRGSGISKKFGNSLVNVGKKADKLSNSLRKSAGSLKGLVAQLAIAAAVQKSFTVGLDRDTSERRLAALARGYNEIALAQQAALRIAQQFNISQTQANKEFATAYARLRPLGLSLNQIEDAYAGIQTVVKTASLDAGAAAALFTQVAQALGSGVVQAEELNTVIDQAPALVVALADELGVAVGEVKNLTKEGKVTSEALFKALKKVKEDGVDVLAESLLSPRERINAFGNATQDVVANITTAVLPTLADALDNLTEILKALEPLAARVGQALALAFKGFTVVVQNAIDAVSALFRGLKAGISGDFAGAIKELEFLFTPTENILEKLKRGFSTLTAPLPQAGAAPERTGGGNEPFPIRPRSEQVDSAGSAAALKKQEKETKKILDNAFDLLEKTLEQVDAAKELKRVSENELGLLGAKNELEEASIRYANAKSDIEAKYAPLLAANLSKLEESLLTDAKKNELAAAGLQYQKDKNAALEEEASKQQQLIDQLEEAAYQRIGQAIEDTIVVGLEKAITKADDLNESLQEIAASLLKDIGRLFIRAGVSSLAGPGGLGLPGFADGGVASPGSPALVGEKGPEIITPLSPTLVTPFDATREAVADSAQGIAAQDAFSENAAMLGAAASTMTNNSAAAKQEAAMASSNQTLNIETTVINSVEYATVAQVQAASAAAAKTARARVFGDLKNSPSRRGGLGL